MIDASSSLWTLVRRTARCRGGGGWVVNGPVRPFLLISHFDRNARAVDLRSLFFFFFFFEKRHPG